MFKNALYREQISKVASGRSIHSPFSSYIYHIQLVLASVLEFTSLYGVTEAT